MESLRSCGSGGGGGGGTGNGANGNDHGKQETSIPISATEEEVDEFIDQNIQINSNKQMRVEYLYPWTLKFKDNTQEAKYCQLREDMFRSNMLSVFIVWIFIVLCQAIIVPRCTVLVICLAVSTILLTAGCVLVMAEEFSALPIILQKSSATLVHHRNRRTLFICSVIVLMSAASSIGLFLCPLYIESLQNVTDVPLEPMPQPLPTSNLSFNTEIRFNVLISATIHRNYSNDSAHTIAQKQQQFSSQDLNAIKNELLDKIVDKTSEKLANSTNATHLYRRNAADAAATDNGSALLFTDFDDLIMPTSIIFAESTLRNDTCFHPEYMIFTWILCLIALATGLKLYYLVKTFMATIMVCCYAVLILFVFPDVFDNASTESTNKSGIPLSARMNILLVVFLTMVTYHARLVEVTSRLDFIWKEQAEKELSNMKSNRILNDLLIKVRARTAPANCQIVISKLIFNFCIQNILPDHVASYYLSDGRSDELYAKMHNMCGVMFASIPNFQDFYSEDIENGKACIRILNEIICDFDSLMDEPRFTSVEKIKTVGATYMAASGLNPKHQVSAACKIFFFSFSRLMCVSFLDANVSFDRLTKVVAKRTAYAIWLNLQ